MVKRRTLSLAGYNTLRFKKQCRTCGEIKTVSEYYLRKGKPEPDCAQCCCANDRRKLLEDPALRDRSLAQWRARRAANPDKFRERARNKYLQYRDVILAKMKQRYLENPEQGMAAAAIRRIRKTSEGSEHIKPGIMRRLMDWQKGLCPYCRANLNVTPCHRDHVIPLVRGGIHAEKNIQLTCAPCNRRKGAKDPIAFGGEMGIFTPSVQLAI